MLFLLPFLLVRLSFAQVVCLTNQTRPDDAPSGDLIAATLNSNLPLSGAVCNGTWRAGDNAQLEDSFNYWYMTYDVRRANSDTPLQNCQEAFSDIIAQCITNGTSYGGSWQSTNESYSIFNAQYPKVPLPVKDVFSLGPQTSTEIGTFTTTTVSIQSLTTNSATTTSVNGHATILPIWFVSAGIGILLIPGPNVAPGGIIPPPPTFSPITFDPGDGHIEDPDETQQPNTTTSTINEGDSCPTFGPLPTEWATPFDYDALYTSIDTSIWASIDSAISAQMSPSPDPSPSPSPSPDPTPTPTSTEHDAPTSVPPVDCHTDPSAYCCQYKCEGPDSFPPKRSSILADKSSPFILSEIAPNCQLDHVISYPNWPSFAKALKVGSISKYWGMNTGCVDSAASSIQKYDSPQDGKSYDTEHVYEKNLIRRFLYYVAGGSAQFQDPSLELFDSPLDSCMGMKNVFDSLTDQGEFTTQTAGQQLANALSCYGGAKGSRPCPDLEGRASELGLLESRLNNGKSKLLNGKFGDSKKPQKPLCFKPDTQEDEQTDAQKAMQIKATINGAFAVFDYMNSDFGSTAWNKVHTRMIDILANVDADPRLGAQDIRPKNIEKMLPGEPFSWSLLYQEFMQGYLSDVEYGLEPWLQDCVEQFNSAIGASGMTNEDKVAEINAIRDFVMPGLTFSRDRYPLSS